MIRNEWLPLTNSRELHPSATVRSAPVNGRSGRENIRMEKVKAYAVKPDKIDTDSPNTLINRELSWLGFARRVLALAEDPDLIDKNLFLW